jgi:CO/xanthine dehydrogenase FAD-binding subunit
MQPFDYYRPKTFEEAFDFLTLSGKTVMAVAGATDFVPSYRDEVWKTDAIVDIKALPGMRDIRETDEGLFIGAAVRMSELARSPLLNSGWNILAQGAEVVGSEQVRNRATLGGNMCTASPCADTPPALYVLEAVVLLKSKTGERRVPVTEFTTFVRKTVIQKGELVLGVILPKLPKSATGSYIKLARRKCGDLAQVSVAALAVPKDGGCEWRLALGAVAPTPLRVPDAEKILTKGTDEASIKMAAEAAEKTSRPISDIRASLEYRQAMVYNMTRRAIHDVLAKMK